MKIINTSPGHEQVYGSRGWKPEDVRKKYRAGQIKLISAIRKLADTFHWSLSKSKAYLLEDNDGNQKSI